MRRSLVTPAGPFVSRGSGMDRRGSHLIDQALALFGPAATVYAELDRRRPGSEVDDDCFVALTHASGVRSHLWMSAVAARRGARLRVLGERAAFVKVGMDVQEEALRAGVRPRRPRLGARGAGARGTARLRRRGAHRAHRARRLSCLFAAVAAALRGGGPPPVDPWDAVAVLETIARAQRAAAAPPAGVT